MTELQQRLLDIMLEIDKVCQNNNIDYFLTGGTLIGAKRHNGFIPWDDDADIIMSRDNWFKFYEHADELPQWLTLNTQYDNPDYAMTVNHVTDNRTAAIFRYNMMHPEKSGITVDVLIMDPLPDDEEAKTKYIDAVTAHSDLTCTAYPYSSRSGRSSHFSYYLNECKTRGKKEVLKEIDEDMEKFTEEESSLYVQRFASAPHFWQMKSFGKPQYVPFENVYLPIPERADECLSIGYDDDWMYVPRGGDTKSTHEYCVRNDHMSSDKIFADFEKQIDRSAMEELYHSRKILLDDFASERVKTSYDNDIYFAAKIKLLYKNKLKDIDVEELIKEKKYDELSDIFDEYISSQCNRNFLGSSSLASWRNWARKCYPYLIDIGDVSLYAVCILLLHNKKLANVGKLLKARSFIERPFTKELLLIESLYTSIKEARSHLDCNELTECKEVLSQYEEYKYDIPFLCIMDIRSDEVPDENKVNEALTHFPEDDELNIIYADICKDRGDHNTFLEKYNDVTSYTDNGLVLLHMKNVLEDEMSSDSQAADPALKEVYEKVLEASGYEFEENDVEGSNDACAYLDSFVESDEKDKESRCPVYDGDSLVVLNNNIDYGQVFESADIEAVDFDEPSSNVLKIRFKLLQEIHEICVKNNIDYFLSGKALLQAIKYGDFVDINSPIDIIVTTNNAKKLIDCLEADMPSDRYIDSMKHNPDYPILNFRYCDKNSLDFSTTRNPTSEFAGVFINIVVYRSRDGLSMIEKEKTALEIGWERRFYGYSMDTKSTMGKRIVGTFEKISGKNKTSSYIFNKLISKDINEKSQLLYSKVYAKKYNKLPKYLFDKKAKIILRGKTFFTFEDVSSYLVRKYGTKWVSKQIKTTDYSYKRIVDDRISFKEYFDYLDSLDVDREKIWKERLDYVLKCTSLIDMNKETKRYWDIISACGDRYEIAQMYYPIIDQLRSIYDNGSIDQMRDILGYYIHKANYYFKKNICLYVNDELFKYLLYYYSGSGYDGKVEKIKALAEKNKWNEVVL